MLHFSSKVSTGLGRARLSFKPCLEQLEDRCVPARLLTPVIFVPGQPASLPSDFVELVNSGEDVLAAAALTEFLTHLGAQPEDLTSIFELKPFPAPVPGLPNFDIVSPTNALVDALEDKGYVLGVNLFIAAHDWRMPIAPPELIDADDGILRIGTTLDGSDDVFDTGLDYLAYWMDQAGEAWRARTGRSLKEVDIISHSEGYLLTRAYVSSTLYRGKYIDDDDIASKLPAIRNWVSLGAPNGGASGIYNLLQNNFNNDLGNADDGSGLYPIVELAYLAVTELGLDIIRPDGDLDNPLFEGGTVPDPLDFIQQYMPSLRAEMPTYGFLDNGLDVNTDPDFRNDLLLDVNVAGPGRNFFGNPNGFVKRLKTMSVFYGTALPTESLALTQTGPGSLLPLSPDAADFNDLQPTTGSPPWLLDVTTPKNGDRVLPLQSSETLFKQYRHRNLKLYPQNRPEIDHNALVTDDKIHERILKILGVKARHRHHC